MAEDSSLKGLTEKTRPGASMHRRFGLFFYLSGIGFLLRRLRISDKSVEYIKGASKTEELCMFYICVFLQHATHMCLFVRLSLLCF